jgi:hypothetical protein
MFFLKRRPTARGRPGAGMIALEGADQHGGNEDSLHASGASPVDGKAAGPGENGFRPGLALGRNLRSWRNWCWVTEFLEL